jgi:hypothetical protein
MIMDYWETSDLDGLRNAPPLPENDSSDVEDENCSVEEEDCSVEEEADEEEVEDVEEVIPTFKMDIYVRFTMLELLGLLILSALWLMLNTYVLCKDGKC